MIKIGCAAYSYRDYFNKGEMNYKDFIEEAYRIGLDGVEFTLYWLPRKDRSYFMNLKREALYHGLSISGVGISTSFCHPNVSERKKNVESVIEGLKIAYMLGAPSLRVFGGNIPEGYDRNTVLKWVVESIKSCLKYAEDYGVVIAMENHGGITETADSLIEIVEKVGSPWFRINLDLGNYRRSIYREIEKTTPYAVHIHAKIRAGDMILDYKKIKEILLSKGYNGFLSIEYEEKEDPKTGVPKFAKYLFEIFG